MLRRNQITVILFIIIIFALVSVVAKSDSRVGILSKKSHAEKLWERSGHAQVDAEAFTHWDEEGEIPTSCAKCHSTPGFQDFIATGAVNAPAPIGTTVECEACHIDPEQGIVRDHTSVVFPSGVEVENLGPEALCMECHQGRASTRSVDDAIARAGVDDDSVSPSLRFINLHYYAAAASQFGTVTKGGYEYSGKSYDARFSHIKGYNACITCHNPHSLEVNLEACNTCHTGIKDPKNIRFYGSFVDYDGDGNMVEGIFYEIQTLKEKMYNTMRRYTRNVTGIPIAYDPDTYPYFFIDTNDNGVADPSEATSSNAFSSFTPRLVRATYNLQVAQKDPNGYAHGGKYIIELLYDSMEDLNSALSNPFSMAGMNRVDEGHFNGSAEPWRHWDEEGEVSGSCAKCHSAEGLPYFIEHGENVEQEISNGLLCTTCHTSPPNVRQTSAVTFPSGAKKDLGDSSNICMNCHQGRASRFSVAEAVKQPGPYSFINIHYYPTAAVLFGSEVHGGFEFEGKIYRGRERFPNHNGKFDTCVKCHMGTKSDKKPYDTTGKMHNVQYPDPEDCVYCHGQDISQPNPGADPTKFEFSGIRPASIPDYDGDGNISESIQDEIKGLEDALYDQMKIYSANILGAPVLYDPDTYPYFFNDLNENGEVDPGENIFPNGFNSFNARLLKAAYNLHLSKKEPCGYIHNSHYVGQLLVDSIEHLRGDISSYTWR